MVRIDGDGIMEYKTPYYVIHKNELDINFDRLKNEIEKYWKNYIIDY